MVKPLADLPPFLTNNWSVIVLILVVLIGLGIGLKDVLRFSITRAWAISSVNFAESIRRRVKQPYRAPDSASFFREGRALAWVDELLSPQRIADAGLFDPTAVGKLLAKCRAGRAIGFGDNMAFVGVLSTMLLHEHFVRLVDGPRSWT